MSEHLQWDIGLTGELVISIFGAAQWVRAHPSVRSMTDRPEFCRYHYHEALGMMNRYVEGTLKESGLLGVYQDYDEFSYLMLKIRANITAFAQSLHAVPDTCSHMLYHCLALDKLPNPLKERDVSAKTVLKVLERERDADHPEYGRLCGMFEAIAEGDDYKYLNALTNTLKHRSIIRPQLNQDVTGKRAERYVLFLESFWYAGDYFKELDVREFMQRAHDRIQPLTVDIGVELNHVLRRLPAQEGKTPPTQGD